MSKSRTPEGKKVCQKPSVESLLLVNLDEIIVGQRHRKQQGDLAEFAEAIKLRGLLVPIGITPEKKLIYGERRLNAVKLLGWEQIPCRVIQVKNILEAECDENVMRKGFVPSEMVALAEAITKEIGKGRGGDRKSDQCQKIGNDRGASPIAAKRVGLGNRETYRQAKAVVE